MARDKLFTDPASGERAFRFDAAVAQVFDDMALRSIPCYQELQALTVVLARRYAAQNTTIYDLGCSTGTTLHNILAALPDRNLRAIGIDSCAEMLERARAKCARLTTTLDLRCNPIENGNFEPASFITALYTVQFVPTDKRLELLTKIRNALSTDGALLIAEKTAGTTSDEQQLLDDLYYAFKERQGYSREEIERKRAALEGVLIPLTRAENEELLKSAGFRRTVPVLSAYQFVAYLVLP